MQKKSKQEVLMLSLCRQILKNSQKQNNSMIQPTRILDVRATLEMPMDFHKLEKYVGSIVDVIYRDGELKTQSGTIFEEENKFYLRFGSRHMPIDKTAEIIVIKYRLDEPREVA